MLNCASISHFALLEIANFLKKTGRPSETATFATQFLIF